MVSSQDSIICGVKGCQRRFKTLYNVEKHRNLHELEGKYVCENCGKRYIEKSALSHHKRRHLEKQTQSPRFECFTCGKTFSKSRYLHRHEQVHNVEQIVQQPNFIQLPDNKMRSFSEISPPLSTSSSSSCSSIIDSPSQNFDEFFSYFDDMLRKRMDLESDAKDLRDIRCNMLL